MSKYEYDFSDGVKQITAIMKGEDAEWEPVTTQIAEFCLLFCRHLIEAITRGATTEIEVRIIRGLQSRLRPDLNLVNVFGALKFQLMRQCPINNNMPNLVGCLDALHPA